MCSGSLQIRDQMITRKMKKREPHFKCWLFVEQWLLLLYRSVCGYRVVRSCCEWLHRNRIHPNIHDVRARATFNFSVSVSSQDSCGKTLGSDVEWRKSRMFPTLLSDLYLIMDHIWKWPEPELKRLDSMWFLLFTHRSEKIYEQKIRIGSLLPAVWMKIITLDN